MICGFLWVSMGYCLAAGVATAAMRVVLFLSVWEFCDTKFMRLMNIHCHSIKCVFTFLKSSSR